ncbi:MAG: 2-oxoacid:acceptor oxidoreductase family protein [Anaerovoracaceae bacterium]|jgi:2-oxoglutarate ferredoxin oxidoreductase subunit gamma
MSKQTEIIISGVGGQGTILCGTMIAEAAVLHDHLHATLSSEYGVETRGTFAKSDVIISAGEIYFPDVTDPDLVICLADKAYERYSGKIENGALMIYDSSEVTPDPLQAEKEVGADLGRMARDIGNPTVRNIIVLGVIIGYLEAVSPDGAKERVREFFGKRGEKIVQMNLAAFDRGYEAGTAIKKAE